MSPSVYFKKILVPQTSFYLIFILFYFINIARVGEMGNSNINLVLNL
jgi:hypothetical protein